MSDAIKSRVESAKRSLIERAKATLQKYGGPCPDAQAAEIERLTYLERAMGSVAKHNGVMADQWKARATAAEAERDTLRALVSEALPVWIEWVRANPPAYPALTGFDWLTRARAALGGQP